MELQDNPNEVAVIRARLHTLADTVHEHGIKLELHAMEFVNVKKSLERLAATAASGDQLAAATQIVQLKLDRVSDDILAVRNQIMWGVRLVLGAVILAVIALVTRGVP